MEQTQTHHESKDVTIIIDKKEKKSPNPTTGAALYGLGEVRQGYELLREVHGGGDDEVIPDNATPIDLKNGEMFYSSKRKLNPGVFNGAARS